MFSKLIILLAVVAVASTTKPYLGYPLPFYPKYINGASEVTRNAYPYVVSLQWGHTNYTHFCAGAILSSSWIITSAHCASVVPPYGDFVVKIGKHNLNIEENTEETIRVQKTIIHEDFAGKPGYHDIALLKLSKSIALNNIAKSISLASSSTPSGILRMLSWGSTWRMYTPIMPAKLQSTSLSVISNIQCKNILSNITDSTPMIGGWQFCTGPTTDAFTTCDSEPGAPLVQISGSSAYLVGIVSWGVIPCGTTNSPLVFANIYYYKSWIQSKQSSN